MIYRWAKLCLDKHGKPKRGYKVMKKTTLILLAVGAMAFVLGACGGGGSEVVEEIDAGDASAPVAIQVGQKVKLDLEENPSTGYSWRWECDVPEAVELVGDDYEQGGEEGMVGAPGLRSFRFAALAPGKVAITFHYGQDWEGGLQDEASDVTLVLNITE